MKSFLIKVNLAGIEKLANTGSWCSFEHKKHNILQVKSYDVLCFKNQFFKNNIIIIKVVPYIVEGLLTVSKNKYGFTLKNLYLHLGKLQEIFLRNIEKKCSCLKKSFQIFITKNVLPVKYMGNYGVVIA